MSDSAADTEEAHSEDQPGSLKRTLILWFMLMALLPMSIVALISYQQANKSLAQAAEQRMDESANSTLAFLRNWFDYRVIDLEAQAEAHGASALLAHLNAGLQLSGTSAAEYVTSYDWALRVDEMQVDLVNLTHRYDYLNDVFLINSDGRILYSVVHESDLGTSLLAGPLADTGFARAVRATLEDGRIAFSDLDQYSASDNEITAFLVAPLLDDLGGRIGVYVMQIDLDPIFRRTNAFDSTESSRIHYLVGKDGRLRTELQGAPEGILERTIATAAFQRWQRGFDEQGKDTKIHTDEAFEYMGPNGRQVIGMHHNLHLPGTDWALISEIDRDEAFAAADWLGKVTVALAILSGFISAALAWNQANRITRPLIRLASASRSVAAGNISQPVQISADNEIGTLAHAFNHMVTTRQQHVQALEQSKLLAQEAMADLAMQKFAMDQHSIVAITDVKGTITFVNDKFVEISGYARDELLGQNHRLLNSNSEDRSFWRDMYRTIARGDVWRGEICNRAKDGHLYWVDSTFVPFMGENGNPSSYVAMRTDITALKQAEEAAEAGSQAKSEFLANMSHEIRTPMNGVIGMTSLLLDSKLNHEQHGHALTIKRSAESLLDIINDILDFSKIEAGKLDLEIVDFDLGALLEDLASTMAFRAEDKKLELVCPAEPVIDQWYQGDPGRIRQILTNLIDNAIKFSEAGEVVVHQERTDHNKQRSMLRFTITDSGIGLDAEERQKLFQKFTQADSSTTRRYGGTGLGLSICKQLVEMMGGAIGVTSNPGEGSTFWFTLELGNAEAPLPARRSDDLLSEKILVVDDNAVNRQLLGQILDAWQVEHALAGSGLSALQALRIAARDGKPYSIAVIDMQMPEMDGAQLGTLIRDDAQLAGTRRVLLTSQGRRGDAKKMQASGFSAYLSKPVHRSELYNALLQVAGIDADDNNKRLITRYTAREQPQFQAQVLVVEDNLTNQAVANGMLQKFGIDIDLAGNGLEAVSALETRHYDLVFMDCQMPEMDGYEATRHIRDPASTVRNHAIPVIAMTAHAMQGDREKCLQAGMDDYIAKPVDPTKLRRALERWLPDDSRSATAQLQALNINGALPTTQPCAGNGKAAATPCEPVFDDAAMNDRLMGDAALMRSVAEAFLDDMKEQIATLRSAAAAGDAQQTSAQAHKIKGAAANVGGMALSARALEMEHASKAGEMNTICAELPQLEQSFSALRAAMEDVLF